MTQYPDFKIVAEQLVQTAQWASRMGWAPATSSNYSVRLPDDASPAYCAITSSGIDKSAIEVEHILAVNQHGTPIDADGLKPSAETPLHLLLYRTMGAGAVFHTHSLPAALLSQLAREEGQVLLSGWELLKGLSGVDTHEIEISLPVFPNSQDMQALSTHVEQALSKKRSCYGFLLAGHGLYAWGKDVPEAKRHLEVFEYLLQCQREVTRHGHSANTR
ncbi:MAG TPA: methylthioribulose 1-phosphate dehydratase [Nitrospiraceae bacterium]|jgi:methylthioribulose-1-phosphate dehydratase|nr:methylthioribulose 1-phosphate dehydratase [Nitrospiraceae bacterium]